MAAVIPAVLGLVMLLLQGRDFILLFAKEAKKVFLGALV